ncbi:hypothetical protein J2I47_22935 [Fibrella sp. HMF5335]|uniref:Uncharacterized protein n=1 Tax=Fibrella rubiginis TaxID=2817060 RepID=A0A939GN07_9BACT|nr:hypothetical protein [Fibrella rubiginis]MBO0939423.1 hypothetical protein [Fibrella rubiginis]
MELGIFIGAHRFAPSKSHNSRKKYIVMDSEPYRYQRFISDLGGQDIRAYGTNKDGQVEAVIQQVRDFLRTSSRRKLPGPDFFHSRYIDFMTELPIICDAEHLDIQKLTYRDYLDCVLGWLVGSGE